LVLDVDDADTLPLSKPDGYVVSYMNNAVRVRSEANLEYVLSLVETIKTQPLHPLSQQEYVTVTTPGKKAEPAHSRKIWLHGLWQLIRFGIVGGLNTAIDVLLLNVFLWIYPTNSTLLVLLFNSIAYVLGAVNSFLLNKYWTFKNYKRPTLSEVARFSLTTAIGVACSDVILGGANLLLTRWISDTTLLTNLSKLLAIMGTVGISYLGMRLWVFVQKTKD
jgi:putative flippase GtrA